MSLRSKLTRLLKVARRVGPAMEWRTSEGLARTLAGMTLRTCPIEGLRSDDPAVIQAFIDRPSPAVAIGRLKKLAKAAGPKRPRRRK